MWKDQLITHRVSDLNEWNAENIERKIQLYAKLKRKKSSCALPKARGEKKTISFAAEWIHLFLRLPSFLCFISFPSFFSTSFIYENAKCSFVRSIINSVVLLIAILSLSGRLKAEPKQSFFIVSLPRDNFSHLFNNTQKKKYHFILHPQKILMGF